MGKGVQGLIAALPYVLQRAPDTQLIIVGSGRYRDVLEALVFAIATADEALLDELVARGNDLDHGPAVGGWTDVADYLADPEHDDSSFLQAPTSWNTCTSPVGWTTPG